MTTESKSPKSILSIALLIAAAVALLFGVIPSTAGDSEPKKASPSTSIIDKKATGVIHRDSGKVDNAPAKALREADEGIDALP